ncbi:MAG: hypothetical protein M1830_006293 [Pleopsidium flavum]|nr:MAG: hypothetical protein M1830_006293 [Pleopsidium flavum]
MAKGYPDLMISVGSGYCKALKTDRRQPKAIRKLGIPSNLKALYRIAVDHIESSLDSEAAWQSYTEVLAPADDERYRFQRFNVELQGEPPKLDDVDSMDDLEDTARKQWFGKERIIQVAHHLLATCFFFEKTRVEPLGDSSFECIGSIQCRFPPGTPNIQHLGEFLRNRENDRHTLYFIIRERYRETEALQVVIGQNVIEEMMRNGRFAMGQMKFTISNRLSTTEMLLSLGGSEEFPISGFPRTLQHEDAPKIIRPLGSSSHRQRTPSQMQRRGQWPGPQALEVSGRGRDDDTISRYSDPGYVIGDSTPGALDEISERFRRSTLELAAGESTGSDHELEGWISRFELEA